MTIRFAAAVVAAAQVLIVGSAQAQIREAAVTGGRVSGVVANGIAAFKGIPFAAPPIGALRWKAPQPVKEWTGVKAASTFTPGCIQDTGLAKLFGAPDAVSEDCLYLNVWTPAASATERLPVMVWIYGGAFTSGMTSIPAYDGVPLAEKGVVLVSVSYRLGVFGFLAHPELSKESGKGSGNYGLQDQIAGLRWVKDNIARFGGDPNRSRSLASPPAVFPSACWRRHQLRKGCFTAPSRKAAATSVQPRTANEGGATVPSLKVAETTGQAFLKRQGVADIAAARALSIEQMRARLEAGLQGHSGRCSTVTCCRAISTSCIRRSASTTRRS